MSQYTVMLAILAVCALGIIIYPFRHLLKKINFDWLTDMFEDKKEKVERYITFG